MLFVVIALLLLNSMTWLQEGVSDPPSISSISRLLRGGSRDLDGKKDYSIDGILGGEITNLLIFNDEFIEMHLQIIGFKPISLKYNFI